MKSKLNFLTAFLTTICLIVQNVYASNSTNSNEDNIYVSYTKNIEFLSEKNEKINFASDVTEEMCHSNYWKDKIGVSGNNLLMTTSEIDALNKSMLNCKSTYMYDLENMPDTYETHPIQLSVPTNEYYVNGNIIDNEKYFGKMIDAISKTGYDGKMKTQYAIVTKRVDMKDWPTDDIVGYSADDTDDELQSTALNVNEPFIIRQKCIIDGKTFYNGCSTCCSGWVSGDNIAICSSKEEWLDSWKVQTDSKDHIVVTDDMIMLEPSTYVPEISEVRLMFGTVLKLVPKDDIPKSVGERGTWNNYVVYLPTRNENGRYAKKYALIAQHHKVNVGYLPLTQSNVLDVAFNCLGNRYGWGGMLGAMDCSMYTRQIYKCFGLEIPRNTTWQSAIPGKVTDISQMDSDEKLKYIESIPVGSLLEFNGHITVYIGSENGMAYVISDTGSVVDSKISDDVIGIMSVIINPLDVRRANGTTWLENMRNAIIFDETGSRKDKAVELLKKVHYGDIKDPAEDSSKMRIEYSDFDNDGIFTANDAAIMFNIG